MLLCVQLCVIDVFNMETINTVITRLRNFAIDKGLSVRAFATLAGLSEGAVRGLHKNNWNPNVRTLRKLEAVIAAEHNCEDAYNSTREKGKELINE